MGLPTEAGDLSSEMEVDAFRRLFPLRFYERHLSESIRPDGRALKSARDTSVALGQWKPSSFFMTLHIFSI